MTTINIQSNLAIMLDTCEFTVAIPNQAVARPKGGQEVIVTTNLGREFGGIIVNVQEVQAAVATQLDYKVRTRDYSFLLDRHVAFKEYAAKTYTYDQIVKDLVATYGGQDGFTTKNVQGSYTSEYTRIDYQPVAQSINLIAQKISWTFYIDYFRDVHFYPLQTNVSPLSGNTLNVDTDTSYPDPVYGQLGVYGNLEISEDVSQLRNRVFLRGHKVTASYSRTETFTGNGSQTSFGLAYEPSHTLATNVTVTVAGAAYTVKADLKDGTPANTTQDSTAYINFQSQLVRFNVAPANGATVVVTYKPMLPLIVMVENPDDQKVMQQRIGGRDDGVFEHAISDPTLSADNTGPALARGNEQIAKFGLPHLTVQFQSYLHGWQAGSYFLLSSTRRFGGELQNKPMFVTKVQKRLVSHPTTLGPTQPLFLSTISAADTVYVF